jgi:hypothetical protein
MPVIREKLYFVLLASAPDVESLQSTVLDGGGPFSAGVTYSPLGFAPGFHATITKIRFRSWHSTVRNDLSPVATVNYLDFVQWARQSSPYLRGGVRSKGGIDVPCQGASIKPFTKRCTGEGFAQRRNRRALLNILPALALIPHTVLIWAILFSNMQLGYLTPKIEHANFAHLSGTRFPGRPEA